MSDTATRRKALGKLGLLALAGYIAPAMTDLTASEAQAKGRSRSRARAKGKKKGTKKKS